MPKTWIFNRLFTFVSLFSSMLKLASKMWGVNVWVELFDGSDERIKGVVWNWFSGIPTQIECV
jgi:hypothetical protein